MQQTKHTYQDYLSLSDDERVELIEGEFVVAPAPSIEHQSIVRNIATALWLYVRDRKLGKVLWAPTDVVLSPETVLQPDILFVSNQARESFTAANLQGAPDLTIEVLSPGTAVRDKGVKRELYARFGVKEYWIVDPIEESVEVFQFDVEGSEVRQYSKGRVSSSAVDGFEIEIAQIFAE
jgi:Uma2 family endonuclease